MSLVQIPYNTTVTAPPTRIYSLRGNLAPDYAPDIFTATCSITPRCKWWFPSLPAFYCYPTQFPVIFQCFSQTPSVSQTPGAVPPHHPHVYVDARITLVNHFSFCHAAAKRRCCFIRTRKAACSSKLTLLKLRVNYTVSDLPDRCKSDHFIQLTQKANQNVCQIQTDSQKPCMIFSVEGE